MRVFKLQPHRRDYRETVFSVRSDDEGLVIGVRLSEDELGQLGQAVVRRIHEIAEARRADRAQRRKRVQR